MPFITNPDDSPTPPLPGSNVVWQPPPPSPPTLNSAPTVSSTPNPGQGVALDLNGFLPASAAASGLRVLAADPSSPRIGEFWFRSDTLQFCVQAAAGVKRVTLA